MYQRSWVQHSCLIFYMYIVFLNNYKNKIKNVLAGTRTCTPFLHYIQAKLTTILVNNFSNFLTQFNIYFKKVWHSQEKNSRSVTVSRKACLNTFGEHAVHCKELRGFKYIHDFARDVLFDILKWVMKVRKTQKERLNCVRFFKTFLGVCKNKLFKVSSKTKFVKIRKQS